MLDSKTKMRRPDFDSGEESALSPQKSPPVSITHELTLCQKWDLWFPDVGRCFYGASVDGPHQFSKWHKAISAAHDFCEYLVAAMWYGSCHLLHYWRAQLGDWPNLSHMAAWMLVVPPCSAPSKHIFCWGKSDGHPPQVNSSWLNWD